MLHEFLLKNREQVLKATEEKAIQLAGSLRSSSELKEGLPIFYRQLLTILKLGGLENKMAVDARGMAKAATENDEPAMAQASGRPDEVGLAQAAGLNGKELLRLGYTLSHVVHAYGAMCQAITELATEREEKISPKEFHDLNRCLDIAIAGAVTEYQASEDTIKNAKEMEHLGFLAHELRNTLSSVNISLQMIRKGKVGFEGSTGKVLDRGLKRFEELIDRSLTEVRLRVDPKINSQSALLSQVVDQIVLTAQVDASARNQILDIQIDPALKVVADLQLLHSAIANLIQNAIKYTRKGGKIQVRGSLVNHQIVIEVEDECGGLAANSIDLFKPYVQQNNDRKGVGLGLTIAQRAIELNQGSIDKHARRCDE